MPALVNYRGKDDVCTRGFFFQHCADPSLLLSVAAPHLDVYRPPCKRSRVTAPFIFPLDEQLQLTKPKQQQQQQNEHSIDTLPDECLFEILRRLPGSRERCVSACVSKRWLSLLSSIRSSEIPNKTKLPDLNEEAALKDTPEEEAVTVDGCLTRTLKGKEVTDVRLASIAVGTSGRGGLGKLIVQGSHPTRGVTDKGLSAIARGCPSLRVLSLWNIPRVTDAGLSEIADGCPLLEKLDLTGCPLVSDKGLISVAKKCRNLTSLTVESCASIGNEGLPVIGRCCPQLNSVTIKNCPFVGDQGVSGLVSSAGATLAKIKLQGLNISDATLAVVGYYGKAVTDLTFSGLQLVGERGFWVMANALGLQNLKLLSITSCPGLTDVGLASMAKCCPALKQLTLRRCNYMSDAGLKALSEAARLLEGMQMEECNRITLSGVLAALVACGPKFRSLALVKCLGIRDITCSGMAEIPSCMSLHCLTIRDCPGFSDASLAMVGKICPMLESVELSGLGDVSDNGLLPLIETSAGRLSKVNLCGNVNLTDTTVCALVKANGSTLRLLNLDGCKKVTDKSILEIAESCCTLGELDLSKCMISDYGVAVLACARQLKLRVLSLAGCAKVTQKSLPFLGNMGSSLAGLNVQSCCNLIGNHHGLASLEEKLWWCDILA